MTKCMCRFSQIQRLKNQSRLLWWSESCFWTWQECFRVWGHSEWFMIPHRIKELRGFIQRMFLQAILRDPESYFSLRHHKDCLLEAQIWYKDAFEKQKSLRFQLSLKPYVFYNVRGPSPQLVLACEINVDF